MPAEINASLAGTAGNWAGRLGAPPDAPAILSESSSWTWRQLAGMASVLAARDCATIPLSGGDPVKCLAAAFAANVAGKTIRLEGEARSACEASVDELTAAAARQAESLESWFSKDLAEVVCISVDSGVELRSLRGEALRPRAFAGQTTKATDCVALVLSSGFTLSLIDALQTLYAGGRVLALPAALSPRRLATIIREKQPSVLHTTAATLIRLAQEFPQALRALRLIFVPAEDPRAAELPEISPQTVGRTMLRFAHAEANGTWAIQRFVGGAWGPIEPADGIELRIVAPDGGSCPEGVSGEIQISDRASTPPGQEEGIRTGVHGRRNGCSVFPIAAPPPELAEFSPAMPVDGLSPTEQQLQDIWRTVLQKTQFKVTDNFFDAGGRSMGLLRVAALIQERLRRKVPLVALFSHPTIRGLVAKLDAEGCQ